MCSPVFVTYRQLLLVWRAKLHSWQFIYSFVVAVHTLEFAIPAFCTAYLVAYACGRSAAQLASTALGCGRDLVFSALVDAASWYPWESLQGVR
jgi:hypothetical protein